MKGVAINNFKRKMETPKATAIEFWHNETPYTLENSVVADAAAQVLSMVYLKDIREDAGAAYSVGAYGLLQRTGKKANSIVQAYCPMDPGKASLALELLAKGIENCSVSVDADKVAKIKENLLKNYDENIKKNSYWLDLIDEYDYTGVDFITDYKAVVNALTPEKIASYLKTILASGNHVEVVMMPEE